MQCPVHRHFKAKRKPEALCYQCWIQYCAEHPRDHYTSGDMRKMGESAVLFEDRLITGKDKQDWRKDTHPIPRSRRGELIVVGVPAPKPRTRKFKGTDVPMGYESP